jgi:formylglycine-generating enzyme required for sulfatase activity
MKYEAKQVGATTTPISQASGLPWSSVAQSTAAADAPNVTGCTGCHLITEAEYMTIAQNILGVASNWSGGSIGSGYIYSGHNDSLPANALVADTDDSNGYIGENNAGGNQRRTLTLSNGEVIWDFAGNVWEWTSGVTTGHQPGVDGAGYAWREWTSITDGGSLPINPLPGDTGIAGAGGWNSTKGMGWVWSSSDDNSVQYGFLRGGNWNFGNLAGIFSLLFSNGPAPSGNPAGFRVSR